jgi:hypothetical protein
MDSRIVAIGISWMLSGCSDCPSTMLDDCVERSVSLQTGVYGRVVQQVDTRTDNCTHAPRPWPGRGVELYVGGSEEPVAEAVTNEDGIFELPATAGDYRLCLVAGFCVPVTVPVNDRVGIDLFLPFGSWEIRDAGSCEPRQ